MIKLAVFDLDGTLAPVAKGISLADIALLKEIRSHGVTLAICSGKPMGYLSGFFRQTELEDFYLIAENGAVLQKGIEYPPEFYREVPIAEEAKATIRYLTDAVRNYIDAPFLQPNQVEFTVYHRTKEELDAANALLLDTERAGKMQGVEIYHHFDCIDVIPLGVNKQSGIKTLCALLGVTTDEVVATGDGINDYPMFECAGVSLGIRLPDPSRVTKNCASITEALRYILSTLC